MPVNKLKLIKDLDNYRYVYYWACPDQGRVSPELPTILHASEWIIEHQTENYQGQERRQSNLDRRKVKSKARTPDEELVFSRRENPEGRRITDKVPVIDLDLCPEKLKSMKDELLN
ncbi:hypothetical protein [Neptuniibacter caesariensis]|uniref:Uncharacterized protein n=1 Tax=Neptuniibacter caesariensis TaxID=207954 RepID=A0A7U8GRN7_NEPCE|nr:hypothetical protein [Neptuniibacter caesariensis]EAR61587.1 hypothetical protein MED92_13071 [Oceanospirillum sp. MED92] [Neptuniibacter caesariensis]